MRTLTAYICRLLWHQRAWAMSCDDASYAIASEQRNVQKHALTQFGEQTSVPQWSGGVATSDPSMGIQACMVCRGFRLLQQSREMWSNLMKAAWTWADGNVEDTSVRTCAENLVTVLINIAGSLTTRGKAVESEAVLREALLVSCQHLNMHVKGAFLVSVWFAFHLSCLCASDESWLLLSV